MEHEEDANVERSRRTRGRRKVRNAPPDPALVEAQRREFAKYERERSKRLQAEKKKLEKRGLRVEGEEEGERLDSRGNVMPGSSMGEEAAGDDEVVSGDSDVIEEEVPAAKKDAPGKSGSKEMGERVKASYVSTKGLGKPKKGSKERPKEISVAEPGTSERGKRRREPTPPPGTPPAEQRRKMKSCNLLPAPQTGRGSKKTLSNIRAYARQGSHAAALREIRKYCGLTGYDQVRVSAF